MGTGTVDTVYLDHQASTPLDPEVLDAMLPWLRAGGNPHSAEHAAGRAAHAAVEGARAEVADLIGAEPDDVVFTSGATEAVNLVLRGLATSPMRVAVSAIEHSCVIGTAAVLARAGGMVTTVPVDSDGIVDLDALHDALRSSDLAAVMAVNNEIGTVQPIREAAAIARAAGRPYLCDAAQAAGRIPLDQRGMGIDYLTLSAHKMYGPQGIGAMSASREARRRLDPLVTGGGQQGGLRAGTLPVALCVGFGRASALARSMMRDDARHARKLSDLMLSELERGIDGVAVNGSLDQRVPQNLNLRFDGLLADDILARLPDVAMSTGSACSSGALGTSHVLKAIGLDDTDASSSIRIGFGRRTTREQVLSASSAIVDTVNALRGRF